MGLDPAPFMYKLFLIDCEDKWVWKTNRDDLIQSRKLSNMFQFIDGLTAINYGEFEKVYQEIYPPELELKRKTA